ncbi:hypothetical protein NL676_014850 [Syzygium grande]|nr:hypothetical protein NL676_014850 [Syzygium grande]
MCFVLRGPTAGSSFPLPLDLECGHETILANYLLGGGDLSAELKDSLDIAKSNRRSPAQTGAAAPPLSSGARLIPDPVPSPQDPAGIPPGHPTNAVSGIAPTQQRSPHCPSQQIAPGVRIRWWLPPGDREPLPPPPPPPPLPPPLLLLLLLSLPALWWN